MENMGANMQTSYKLRIWVALRTFLQCFSMFAEHSGPNSYPDNACHIYTHTQFINCIPVVPHKAVAEVSRIGNYRRDWLL